MKMSNNKRDGQGTAFSVRLLCLILALLMVGGGLTGLIAYLLNVCTVA